MRLIKYFSLFFAITFFAALGCAFGAVWREGVKFDVTNVHAISAGTEKGEYLSIDFVLYNGTETRKLDLNSPLQLNLVDEFGNNYLNMEAPALAREGFVRQSIYPKQLYRTNVLFERPVAKAKHANLQVQVSSIGLKGEIVDVPFLLTSPTEARTIQIFGVDGGQSIEQGKVIHLQVVVSAQRAPDGIIIDAFEQTVHDTAPKLDNTYDIYVPVGAKCGPQNIYVIAKWLEGVEHNISTASESVFIYVCENKGLGIL